MMQITIRRPDDFHLHLRDAARMKDALMFSARVFRRAIIMPNLRPPVKKLRQAVEYRKRILEALPEGADFTPLMSLYLCDETSVDEIREAAESGLVLAAKLYPAGATTNSASGVTKIEKMSRVFEEMSARKMPLLVHAEVTDPEVDIFDRERVFLERYLQPLVEAHPSLKIVLEHASTRDAIRFVQEARSGVAATITVHHMLLSRNDIFTGGLNPHHYCLPVVKTEEDRQAIVEAATSGDPRFFAGTDSAPHPRAAKECSGGAAGIFSAPVAVPLYAELFERAVALERLEAFLSIHGAAFYGLLPNEEKIRLEKVPTKVPKEYPFDRETVVPLWAGRDAQWRVSTIETGLESESGKV